MAAKKTQNTQTPAQKKLHVELVKQMLTLATSGFGLVAALAWNGLVQEFVNTYVKKWIPNSGGIISLFLYAVVITALAVFVTFQLSRFLQRIDPDNK